MIIHLTRPNLAYVVFRHIRLIILTTAVTVVLGIIYCLTAPPKYEAAASLVANFTSLSSGLPSGSMANEKVDTPMDHEEIINSYILELTSAEVLRRVVSNIGPDRLYPSTSILGSIFKAIRSILPTVGEVDPQLARDRAVEGAVARLMTHDLKVEGQRNANVISVTVQNRNREISVEFTRQLIDQFLQLEAELSRNPRLNFIQNQLEIYRKQVADSQQAMHEFQHKYKIASMAEERTATIQQRAMLEQSLMATRAKAAESEARFEALKDQLQSLSPLVVSTQDNLDPLQLKARSDLADLQSRASRLKNEFRPDNPAVNELDRSVDVAAKNLEAAKNYPPLTRSDANAAYQQIQIAMIQAKGDADASENSAEAQQHQLDALDSRLQFRDSLEGKYQDLVREYQLADQNYRVYLQGVQSARVAEDLNKERVTSLAVFDAPYAPSVPKSRWNLMLVLAPLGGLLAGGLLAFLSEALDETLNTPAQLKDVLDIPVLGTVELV